MANKKSDNRNSTVLQVSRDSFIAEWGVLGSNWGISRTMAQIHALLMVTNEPQNMDQIMEELDISRGNAHANLKALIDWGLIRSTSVKGDRKDYFEAEKDVWKISSRIAKERKRREIDPIVSCLDRILEQTKSCKGSDAAAFRKQVKNLHKFTTLGARVMARVAKCEESKIMSWALRFLR